MGNHYGIYVSQMTDMLLFSQFHPPCILLRMYNKGNTTGTNSGEGTVHPIETPKFIPLTVLRCVCVTKSLVIRITPLAFFSLFTVQGSRWRAIRVKMSPCGFVLVPKEKWKSPCNFTKSLC
jgi:hypothetical protein